MLNFDKEKYLLVTGGAVNLRGRIETIIDEVSDKGYENVFLIGIGGTIAAMYPFEYMLKSNSTIPVYAEIAAEFNVMGHKHFNENSLVILYSLSGTTPETVAAAEYCKEKGATTIGLVGELGTPLADTVDYPIANYAENDFGGDSSAIQLYLLIFRLMYKRNSFPQYEKFADELVSIPDQLISVKEQGEAQAEAFAEKYKDEKYHIFTGAGNLWGKTYSYAMCVLEEMQWIRTKSIHAAEFFHGTLEIVDEETSIVVVKGEDETRPLLERVENFGETYTNKLTIFDTADFELNGISQEFRKYLSPLIMNTFLQRVSVHLEDKRGHSLETRRYYRKVEY